MKTKNIIKLIIVIVVFVFTFSACVEDSDYQIPDATTVQDPGLVVTNTIQSVKDMYQGSVVDFSILGDLIIEGYVVSSDETGNIYKTISIQDKPVDPTAAIQLAVDAVDMYTFYEVGRKVYVKLSGLGLEDNNGVLEIGALTGTVVDRISSTSYKNHIVRSIEVTTIQPLILPSINSVNDSYLNMLVQFENIQASNQDETYANVENTFSVNRTFKSCSDNETIILRNSGFADFRAQSIPNKRGTLTAVLGKYRTDFQLYIRSTEDVDFTEDRCDPVFEENFNSAVDNTTLDLSGWINYTEAGSAVWTEQVFNGNGYAELNPFGSGDASNINWLITPSIDLDAQDGEALTFQTEHAYPDAGHEPLQVLISTDFDGTEAGIATATWIALDFNVSYIVDFDEWFTFTDSGTIDLAGFSGNAYVAFRYTGSDTMNQNMTLHVENVKVAVQ
ncbi:hypothetical protein C7447_101206 [Tenacibaculum adriaticum]|uniref:DUF5689 domain-containing protein n=1 Tax=Tenacibaculum adriaticum TaxID=413713 RepID=A0A5S5DX15_9FLAO|nr:DUF5689 domain-containing protein [Tenacibaculum adriaticum]TYP99606.1 hypothetical protein C7447_101206 [Tenacibaculum adriaticum]